MRDNAWQERGVCVTMLDKMCMLLLVDNGSHHCCPYVEHVLRHCLLPGNVAVGGSSLSTRPDECLDPSDTRYVP